APLVAVEDQDGGGGAGARGRPRGPANDVGDRRAPTVLPHGRGISSAAARTGARSQVVQTIPISSGNVRVAPGVATRASAVATVPVACPEVTRIPRACSPSASVTSRAPAAGSAGRPGGIPRTGCGPWK